MEAFILSGKENVFYIVAAVSLILITLQKQFFFFEIINSRLILCDLSSAFFTKIYYV